MNTILITGTAKSKTLYVEYDVHIWASKEGEQIEFISQCDKILDGYDHLWKVAKERVVNYYDMPIFSDGAYTQFKDHIILL